MTTIELQCGWCGAHFQRRLVLFLRDGPNAYCDRKCSAFGRRKGKTKAQFRTEKKAYDVAYRAKHLRRIKRRKKAYFKRTYDPVKAAIKRKARMPKHVEYCRQPEYRKKKLIYDIGYRAKKEFGSFDESALIVELIQFEVDKRMTNYQIRLQQGTLNKMQNRKKALYEKNTRIHLKTHGNEPQRRALENA